MAIEKKVIKDFCKKAGGKLISTDTSIKCELPDGSYIGHISSASDIVSPFEVVLPDKSRVEIMTYAISPECEVQERDNKVLGKIVKLICTESISYFYEYQLEVEHIVGNKQTSVRETLKLDIGDRWRLTGMPRTPVIQTHIH